MAVARRKARQRVGNLIVPAAVAVVVPVVVVPVAAVTVVNESFVVVVVVVVDGDPFDHVVSFLFGGAVTSV